MPRRLVPAALALALLAAAAPARPQGPVPGPARRVLGPTAFPGWQTWHVSHPVVVREGAAGPWRMYYTGAATDQRSAAAWDLRVTLTATSGDLAAWRYPDDYQPVLLGRPFRVGELFDLAAAGEPRFDDITASVSAVLRDGRGWKAWYTGWNGDERGLDEGRVEPVHFRIGHATSADGRRWSKHAGPEQGAVVGLGPPGAPDALAAGHPSVLVVGGEHRLWYEAYDGRTWRIAHARSRDGVDWSKEGAVLEPGDGDAPDALGARHPLVRAVPGGFELWYQGRSRSAPSFRLLRARSVDGLRWTRGPEVVLRTDPPVRGDERVHAGSVIERPDRSLLLFFAKETVRSRDPGWGPVEERTTAIYSQVVAP